MGAYARSSKKGRVYVESVYGNEAAPLFVVRDDRYRPEGREASMIGVSW